MTPIQPTGPDKSANLAKGDHSGSGMGDRGSPPISKDPSVSPTQLTDPLMSDVIGDAIKDARSSYLTMTLFAAYCAIALLGIRDEDFFSSSKEISLPLIGTTIGTNYFFWISPFIMAVLTINFAILAAKLARMLGGLRAEQQNLWTKSLLRLPIFLQWTALTPMDGTLKKFSTMFSVAVASFAVPAVVWALWWWSHTKHDQLLSSFIFLCGLTSAGTFALSYLCAHRNGAMKSEQPKRASVGAVAGLVILTIGLTGIVITWTRTEGDPIASFAGGATAHSRSDGQLAVARLDGADIASRPADCTPRFLWVEEFQHAFKRRYTDAGNGSAPPKQAFDAEWFERRRKYLAGIRKPILVQADLRRAIMDDAFLVGIDMSDARLSNASLQRADMEAVVAYRSTFAASNLSYAHLEQSFLKRADFSNANLVGAELGEALLTCASFRQTTLKEAKLDGAFIEKADMSNANLEGASLRGAYLKRTNLRGADFKNAKLDGAILWGSDLSGATNLTQQQIDGALGDFDTKLPAGLAIKRCWQSIPEQHHPYRRQWWLAVDMVRERALCERNVELSNVEECR